MRIRFFRSNESTRAPARAARRSFRVAEDVGIRALGVAAVAIAVAIFTWLPADIRHHPGAGASLLQLAMAAIGFLGASIGCGLILLGRHIHDRVILSERWRPRL